VARWKKSVASKVLSNGLGNATLADWKPEHML